MALSWEYQKLFDRVYAVIFSKNRVGVVFPFRSGWTFVANNCSTHFFGSTRDEAVAPHLSYKAFLVYSEKQDP